MASLGEDIRTVITGSTAVAAASTRWNAGALARVGVVEQNTVREQAPDPRIWFQREREETDWYLDADEGLTESTWNIEVHSSIDSERFAIADAIKSVLDGQYGTFGSRTVQSCFVEDHDDDYVPRGVASEEGVYVAALLATIRCT